VITAVPGVRVGHWTDPGGRTGCTVALFPEGTVASGEVRGGAPATREFALLEPHRTVERLDAVVLAGGSAFGLAAADGVMAWCEERGVGYPTAGGPVPIVVGLAVFDLVEAGDAPRPGRSEGMAACVAATAGPVEHGRVGAGAGCTVAKWRGRDGARPGGLGGAVAEHDGVVVAALLAVNAVGDLRVEGEVRVPLPPEGAFAENTTVGVVVTNGTATKIDCLNAAQATHDGLARALDPAHTGGDGDAVVVAATGVVAVDPFVLRQLAAVAVEQAVRHALT
jgi:L-aminopeptidase/D-esterase-like protein